MATVLVTGASGFVGRRLVARLHLDGHQVRALVRRDPQNIPELTGGTVELVQGDVTMPVTLEDACAGVERVYHVAAAVGDWGAEETFRKVNVDGTSNLLEAAANAGCQHFIHTSSIVVYGSQLRTGSCDEDSPREPGISHYGRTKREAEERVIDAYQRRGLAFTIVRPANIYGRASSNWVDEPVAIMRKGMGMLIGDGTGDAQLVFVDNVVDVLARVGDNPVARGRIYNASDDPGVTWKQYFSDLAYAVGVAPPTKKVPIAVASAMAATMEGTWRLTRRQARPVLTRQAVQILSSGPPIPNQRAKADLGYAPIPYNVAMAEVFEYLKEQPR